MAKQRYINTRFWSDNFVSELNPLDRYLFLYFLTNEHTNICGIYEVPLRTISFETGIELDMVKKMLVHLTGKVYYIEGWIFIKNFAKHQNPDSPKIKIGIENEMSKIPNEIKEKVQAIDTLSIPYTYPSNYLNSNSNLNLNSNREETPKISLSLNKTIKYLEDLPQEDIKEFVTRFEMSPKMVSNKAESLLLYCKSKGKVYKDYKSFLLNAIKKDIPERKPMKKVIVEEVSELTEEQKQLIEVEKEKIRKLFSTR